MALLVHPGQQWVRLFLPGATPIELRGPDELDFDDVIPGLRFTVDDQFAALRFR